MATAMEKGLKQRIEAEKETIRLAVESIQDDDLNHSQLATCARHIVSSHEMIIETERQLDIIQTAFNQRDRGIK